MTYNGLEDFLSSIAESDIKSSAIPETISSFEIVYMPQLGYLLCASISDNPRLSRDVPGIDFQVTNFPNFTFILYSVLIYQIISVRNRISPLFQEQQN